MGELAFFAADGCTRFTSIKPKLFWHLRPKNLLRHPQSFNYARVWLSQLFQVGGLDLTLNSKSLIFIELNFWQILYFSLCRKTTFGPFLVFRKFNFKKISDLTPFPPCYILHSSICKMGRTRITEMSGTSEFLAFEQLGLIPLLRPLGDGKDCSKNVILASR